MKTVCWVSVLFAILLVVIASPTSAATFLADNFDSYADDAAAAAAGWTNIRTGGTETAYWTVANPPYGGGAVRIAPATQRGTRSTGKFMISDSDRASGVAAIDSGESFDLYSPTFSTIGQDTVWLHASVDALPNDNVAGAVFMVDVSTDVGATWNNAWYRISPDRIRQPGVKTYIPNTTNTDGYFGQLDVNLSALAANAANVQLRFRNYEPHDDWWFEVDDVVVDDHARVGGSVNKFSENFSTGLGQMTVAGLQTGANTWSTSSAGTLYNPGVVARRNVNRLGHPSTTQDFAFLNAANSSTAFSEWMMTPVLDMSGMAEVFLRYEDECRPHWNESLEEVLLMRDSDGDGVAETTDELLATVFQYSGPRDEWNESPYYADRLLDVPEAAGLDDVFFAWRYTKASGITSNWWGIDTISVTGNTVPEPSTLVLLLGAVLGGWFIHPSRRSVSRQRPRQIE